MTEKEFRECWQSGKYRNLPECKTEEGYYDFVSKYVERYGVVNNNCCYVYRSVNSDVEDITHLGCSWTPDEEVCKGLAGYWCCDEIYMMPLPIGIKVIHFDADFSGKLFEEEYLIDMKGLGFVGNTEEAQKTRDDYCVDFY